MKKLCAILSAAVLLIGAGAANVTAGACAHGSHRASCGFIDENNDGICDNCSNEICGGIGCGSYRVSCGFIDEDSDGICDNCGEGIGCAVHHGRGFIDENNDGICDNCAEGICLQNTVGRSHHNKKGGRHRHR